MAEQPGGALDRVVVLPAKPPLKAQQRDRQVFGCANRSNWAAFIPKRESCGLVK
jgi:hypothetical protein